MLKQTLSQTTVATQRPRRVLREQPIVLTLEALKCSSCGVTAETPAFRPFTARAVGDSYDVTCSGCGTPE